MTALLNGDRATLAKTSSGTYLATYGAGRPTLTAPSGFGCVVIPRIVPFGPPTTEDQMAVPVRLADRTWALVQVIGADATDELAFPVRLSDGTQTIVRPWRESATPTFSDRFGYERTCPEDPLAGSWDAPGQAYISATSWVKWHNNNAWSFAIKDVGRSEHVAISAWYTSAGTLDDCPAVVARYVDASNYFLFYNRYGEYYLVDVTGGSWVASDSYLTEDYFDIKLSISCRGDWIVGYAGATAVCSLRSTNHSTSTNVGMGCLQPHGADQIQTEEFIACAL